MEPWRQYGGFYRMVDFSRDWVYTPQMRPDSIQRTQQGAVSPVSPFVFPDSALDPESGRELGGEAYRQSENESDGQSDRVPRSPWSRSRSPQQEAPVGELDELEGLPDVRDPNGFVWRDDRQSLGRDELGLGLWVLTPDEGERRGSDYEDEEAGEGEMEMLDGLRLLQPPEGAYTVEAVASLTPSLNAVISVSPVSRPLAEAVDPVVPGTPRAEGMEVPIPVAVPNSTSAPPLTTTAATHGPRVEETVPEASGSSTGSRLTAVPRPKPTKKSFAKVKKWFSSVKSNFGKRKSRIHESIVPIPISVPNLIPTPTSVQTPTTPKHLPLGLPSISGSSTPSVRDREREGNERDDEVNVEDEEDLEWQAQSPIDYSQSPPLSAWKAWGYYARPWINEVFVVNYPPCLDTSALPASDIDVEQLASTLIDPEDGSEHPERWIPGLTHPSIPPRPSLFSSPPQPYLPSQVHLNPYLRRRIIGPGALFWDIGTPPSTAVHGHSLVAMPLLPCDRAQPATWPMTTHFYISNLADDVEFRWPVLVKNRYGVTVQDVLEWVYRNFQQAVDKEEWEAWPEYLRGVATYSYDKRMERRSASGAEAEQEDCHLKRIDYLGFHSMFRGFEQSIDGKSWYLYVGRPW